MTFVTWFRQTLGSPIFSLKLKVSLSCVLHIKIEFIP